MRRLTTPAVLAAATVLTAALTTACQSTEGASPETLAEVTAAVQQAVPGVEVTDVRTSSGLGSPLSVAVTALDRPVDGPDEARARTRAIAEAVWFGAPLLLERIDVVHVVPPDAGGCDDMARCWVDTLEIPSDASTALWGPADGRQRSPSNRGTSCRTAPELDAIGVHVFTGVPFDTPTPRVIAQYIESAPPEAADVVSEFVWRCHPARIDSIEVVVEAARATVVTARSTAEELRALYGPRPDGLPE